MNYPAPDQDGHSSVFDGMVFEKSGQPNGRPRQQLVFEAGDGEDVYLATLDLEALGSTEHARRWEMRTGNPVFTGA